MELPQYAATDAKVQQEAYIVQKNREVRVGTDLSHSPADNPQARAHDCCLPEVEDRLE